MELKDLQPDVGTFSLKATGRVYHLRPFSMYDEIWLEKTIGTADKVQKVFSNIDMFKIVMIAFHQLDLNDQKEFVKQKVKIINDVGDEADIELGGVELLYSLVSGPYEKKDIMTALMVTIGVSRPMIEKAEKEFNESLKKKLSQSTGQESSTSLPVNTDGQ